MPGPPDGARARAGEQRLLIHGLVRERGRSRGSVVSPGRGWRSIHTARAKDTAFFFEGGKQCYSNKSSVDGWDGYSCSWQRQMKPQNKACDPHDSSSSPRGGSARREGGLCPNPPLALGGRPPPLPAPGRFNALYKPHRCPVTGLCRAPAPRAISSLFCRCIFGSLDCQDLRFISVPRLSRGRPVRLLGAPTASRTG